MMQDKRTMLPSERAAKKTEDDLIRDAQRQEQDNRLTNAMRQTFNTPEGKIVLKWLADQCQFGKPILGANMSQGTIDPTATLYQAMRLNLYLSIRQRLTFDILKEVEYDDRQI